MTDVDVISLTSFLAFQDVKHDLARGVCLGFADQVMFLLSLWVNP